MTKPSQKLLAIAALALASATQANRDQRHVTGLMHACLSWGIAQIAGAVASLGL